MRDKSEPIFTSANALMASLLPLSSVLLQGLAVRRGEKANQCNFRFVAWLRSAPASARTVLKMARLERSQEERELEDFCFFCFIMVSVWKMSNLSLVFLSSSSSSFLRLLWAASQSQMSLFASSRLRNLSACRLNSPSIRLACSTLSCNSPIRLSCSSLVDCLSLISFSRINILRFCYAPTRSSSAFSARVTSKRPNSSRISRSLSCQSLPGSLACTLLRGVGQEISERSLTSSLRWNCVVRTVSLSILMSSTSEQSELSSWMASLSSTFLSISTTRPSPERQLRMSLRSLTCGLVQHSRRYSWRCFKNDSSIVSTCANSLAYELRRQVQMELSNCCTARIVSTHSSSRVASYVGRRFTASQALSSTSTGSMYASMSLSVSMVSVETRSSSSSVKVSMRVIWSLRSGLASIYRMSSSPSAETMASSSLRREPKSTGTWSSNTRQWAARVCISAEQSSDLWVSALATASKSRQSLALALAMRSSRLKRCGCSRAVKASGSVSKRLAKQVPAYWRTVIICSWQLRKRAQVIWWRRLNSQYLCWKTSVLKQVLRMLSSSGWSMLCMRVELLSFSSCTLFLYLFFSSVMSPMCFNFSYFSAPNLAISSYKCSIS